MEELLQRDATAQILIFDDETGEQIDPPVAAAAPVPKQPGRPKLGVVAREVTLLPRHWEWLSTQPGGASVALRKLVETAIRTNGEADGIRRARQAAYRFATAMAGNEPGYEEALRALFAGERPRFLKMIEAWPPDVRDYAARLAFGQEEG